jgi:hypothetical protein
MIVCGMIRIKRCKGYHQTDQTQNESKKVSKYYKNEHQH